MRSYKTETMRAPLKVWDGDGDVPMDPGVLDQIAAVASLPFVWPHACLMPDGHVGIGGPVGGVIPTRGALVPSIVGVDLGCGMTAIRTSLDSRALRDNGQAVRDAIERAVPHGRTDDGGANDRGAWRDVPQDVGASWSWLESRGFQVLRGRNPKLDTKRQANQLATLGTGNHFVEVCIDECDRVWLMLHSGSRGVGNRIGSTYIAAAKKRCERDGITLPNADLAWLPDDSPECKDYLEAVTWAQSYAKENRRLMRSHALDALWEIFDEMTVDDEGCVDCHHNYVSRERHFGEDLWITRKGAVSAKLGELGIIPGAMGKKSFIVRGKGNVDSFHTCSHGAGRSMSRGAAKKAITLADHAAATEGVFCRKDADVIDESPAAYKDIDLVMKAQEDLVEVVHTLKAVVCVKG